MIQKKSEDAVSPVIGVMLLLVVTIVIAAVVAAFAGGVGTDVEVRPATAVEVTDICAGTQVFVTTTSIDESKRETFDYFTYKKDGTNYLFKIDSSKKLTEKPEGEKNVDYVVIEGRESNGRPFKYYYMISDAETTVFGIQESWGGQSPYGDNTALQNEFFVQTTEEGPFHSEKTVTLSCLHGESLDLSKISIKIYKHSNLIIEIPRDSFSGTLTPGDTKSLHFENSGDLFDMVDVVVYYGTYVIAEEEMTVSVIEVMEE